MDAIPASISIVTGQQMRDRGVHDLRGALALVAGVEISPGGDGGPAGSVPAMWGLREFDAFLLVVDGVPVGGAFNPQLTTLTMNNVERIEVLRGSAPVMYGATSFVGVIQVLHYKAGQAKNQGSVSALSHGGFRASVTGNLGASQSLSAEVSHVGSSDDDVGFERAHMLYRAQGELGGGSLSFDFTADKLSQQPASPSPRAGRILDPTIPIGANFNPSNASLDEDRLQAVAGYRRDTKWGYWNTTLSYTQTTGNFVRGFLIEDYADATGNNAVGFEQDRKIDDAYFDTHLETHPSDALSITYGLDWLYGRARYDNRIFAYTVGLDGSNRPPSHDQPSLDEPSGSNWRSFGGLYAQAEWKVSESIDVLAGLRLNSTIENIKGDDPDGGPPPAWARQEQTRLSGTLGAVWHVWRDKQDEFSVYADYRDTSKPAALDFGPEAEAEILLPEAASSYELGARGRLFDGRLDWDVSAFWMDFSNLVVSQSVDGVPGLVNAGSEDFKGAELEANYALMPDLQLAGHYAYHDARFADYEQLFGDNLTQLGGRRLEMSPQHLGGIGLVYAPALGFQASLVATYVGDRYLNKRNTALAGSYTVVDATIGYRFTLCELRFSGSNLGDRRDPVAESELGDAQYYRLPGQAFELQVSCMR